MSGVMRVQPFEFLVDWILTEYEYNQSIFNIERQFFYIPRPTRSYASEMFGHYLATPIGPGAGPHTQLAQNIISSWLVGGRFIELKTVQVMDELEIPRPCIDMADEGYNVEWSQELKLDQSADEYIKAWVLVHALRHYFSFDGYVPFGTIFNMSVGYDLKGIKSEPMVRFMNRLQDASAEIREYRHIMAANHPRLEDVEVPARVVIRRVPSLDIFGLRIGHEIVEEVIEPARQEWRTERVLVSPGRYETVYERVLVRPAMTTIVRGDVLAPRVRWMRPVCMPASGISSANW